MIPLAGLLEEFKIQGCEKTTDGGWEYTETDLGVQNG